MRRQWVVWAASGVGAGLITGGWLMDGAAYTPGFLLEVGVTLLLVIPIAVLERRLQRAEENTQALNQGLARMNEQMRRTAEQVRHLSRMTVDDGYNEREAALRAAESRRDQQSIRQALRDAHAIGAVSAGGVRVRAEGPTAARLRFRVADDAPAVVAVRIEAEADDTVTASPWQLWKAGDNERRICRRLNTVAQGLGADGVGIQRLPLDQLAALLRLAVEAHTGDGRDLGTVIELADTEWVVSDDGLYGRSRPYRIPRDLITRDPAADAIGPYRARNAPLADPAQLAAAVTVARTAYRMEPTT
ncbi:hypothetical protein JIX56_14065 [Streptomyces sp. CA-210063]|uniref:hypothetical protein n=1 Tax=Streptomyces sp. CA-210063 TaxID=2801029 RepID=UPI00214CE66B|nr:hypothetical protein [Streptomyces sp. CA-210063]UUU30942.1 hypothetical protein JIX56_14065 [Streptomyces sp. CA-210063]